MPNYKQTDKSAYIRNTKRVGIGTGYGVLSGVLGISFPGTDVIYAVNILIIGNKAIAKILTVERKCRQVNACIGIMLTFST